MHPVCDREGGRKERVRRDRRIESVGNHADSKRMLYLTRTSAAYSFSY